MATRPVPHVVRAAAELEAQGVTLVAGHSAHVFHGLSGRGPVRISATLSTTTQPTHCCATTSDFCGWSRWTPGAHTAWRLCP